MSTSTPLGHLSTQMQLCGLSIRSHEENCKAISFYVKAHRGMRHARRASTSEIDQTFLHRAQSPSAPKSGWDLSFPGSGSNLVAKYQLVHNSYSMFQSWIDSWITKKTSSFCSCVPKNSSMFFSTDDLLHPCLSLQKYLQRRGCLEMYQPSFRTKHVQKRWRCNFFLRSGFLRHPKWLQTSPNCW